MNTDLMFSSASNEWATPQDLFDRLDAIHHFNLDPASTDENAKCVNHFTEKDDGLAKNWGGTQYFAILHTAKLYRCGLRKPTRNRKSQTQKLSCSSLPGQIQHGFMTIASKARLSFCVGD